MDLYELDCENAFHFQVFLETQERGILEALVIELACNGQGSVQYLKDMVDHIKEEYKPTDGDGEVPEWCKCGVCRPLNSEEENICCGKKLCVTSYQMFKQCIINRDVLELAIKYHCDTRAEEVNFSTNTMRKAAYRQFTMWKYGKLGRGNRRPNPACVVRLIRKAYPSSDDQYMGFKRS